MLPPNQVRDWTIQYLAGQLEMDPSEIDPDRNVSDYGLDSMQAVIMAGVMEEEFSVELEPVIFLRSPTINDLLRELRAEGIVQ